MSQKFLNPVDANANKSVALVGPLPTKLRDFGFYPNTRDWLPGDLVFFSALKPSWISRRIIAAQRAGGFAEADARWHHVAVYIGEECVCEALRSGVRHSSIYDRILTNLIRVRCDPGLTADERYRLAIKALTRLGERYSLRDIVQLRRSSHDGWWNPARATFRNYGTICSQLYADAYGAVTGRYLIPGRPPPLTPGDLSEARTLNDTPVHWLKIDA